MIIMDAGKMKLIHRQIESAEKNAGIGEYYVAVSLSINASEKALKLACREVHATMPNGEKLTSLGNALHAPDSIATILRKLSIDRTVLHLGENNSASSTGIGDPYELYDREMAEEKIENARKVVEWCEKKIEESQHKETPGSKRAELSLDIITHDTLNPAGILRIMSDMLLEEEKDEKIRDLALKIKTNTEKLIEIIKNAKLFSELATKEGLSLGDVDLVSVVESTIKNLKPLADEKNLIINFKSNTKKADVQANAIIEDVFSNMLSNAIKFSPKNEKIEVALNETGGEEDAWKISIADKGPGIPDEHKEAVFARFTRIKKSSVKGSGLGLAIAKRIVELHNGKIWIEDNPGGGSVFHVAVPKRQP